MFYFSSCLKGNGRAKLNSNKELGNESKASQISTASTLGQPHTYSVTRALNLQLLRALLST